MAKDKRFIKIYKQGGLTCDEIWVDRQTGVQYYVHSAGYGVAMTVLVDAEGRPVPYREDREYSPEL